MARRPHVFGLVLLALAAPPCSADIYGYVDEHGAHFADAPLDSRYKLYAKTRPAQPVEAPKLEAKAPETLDYVKVMAPTRAARRYAGMIARVAREQKVEPALLHAVVMAESAYNPQARSPKGATGLMQLMPATGKRYGAKDLLNPLQNLRAGARYLRALLELFDNNLGLAIAAYNAGEGAVMRSGNAIPPYPETRKYVPRVLEYYESYRALAQDS
jgi:soluble lytic murein transglycosylase-like protein